MSVVSRTFPANLAELPALQQWLAQHAAALGMPPQTVPRLQLVAEELFCNSVRHGYAGGVGEVCLRLVAVAGGVQLIYQDAAPPFNPLLHAARPYVEELGGQGCRLVAGLPQSVGYRYADGCNTLELWFA